jgi:hypothetical protein
MEEAGVSLSFGETGEHTVNCRDAACTAAFAASDGT